MYCSNTIYQEYKLVLKYIFLVHYGQYRMNQVRSHCHMVDQSETVDRDLKSPSFFLFCQNDGTRLVYFKYHTLTLIQLYRNTLSVLSIHAVFDAIRTL